MTVSRGRGKADTALMATLLTIGDFSRMTHLSVKALRHYHDVGVLEPAAIDQFTGYRSYDVAQVPARSASTAPSASTTRSASWTPPTRRSSAPRSAGPSSAPRPELAWRTRPRFRGSAARVPALA